MSSARRLHYDYTEYLRALEMSELRLEYQDGVIYAMAGGTPAHAQLSAAMIGLLYQCLPKSCKAATSDMKVRVEATDLSTFPDVSEASSRVLLNLGGGEVATTRPSSSRQRRQA